MKLNFNLPENTEFIINTLAENGYEAYIVGGCVRDLIMNIPPHDWDICTNALPDEVITVFKDFRTVQSGIKHGTVGIIIENALYEVTTFRSETGYSDNRHPDCVRFEKDIQSDLSRRDFTINSIAYNHKDGLIDLYNGYDDIQHKIIKAVGNPDTRFSEDALRILRALRFSSVLCFEIESSTAESIHRNKDLLKNIACERIWSEFTKLLSGKNAHTVIEKYCDVIGVFIPELYAEKNFQQHNPHHCYDVLHHTLSALSFAENNIYLRLAVLFHDIAKPCTFTIDENNIGHFYGHAAKGSHMTLDILKRLKADSKTQNIVSELVRHHDRIIEPTEKAVKRAVYRTGSHQMFELLLKLKEYDIKAQSPEYISERLSEIEKIRKIYKSIKNKSTLVTSVKDLRINGNDIISMGVPQGREVGIILKKLLYMVLDNSIENNRHTLTEAAYDIINTEDNFKNEK